MTVGRLDSARALAAAAMLGLLLFVVLVLYAPDSVAYSPNNYGWNGIEGISSAYHVNFTTSLASVPAKSVLVIMQPNVNFTSADVDAVRRLLAGGGTAVVADRSGVANSLLTGLGSGITIQSEYSISDPIYNWKARSLPTALIDPAIASQFLLAENVSGIALDQPSPLSLHDSADVSVAVTSQLSYDVARPNSSLVGEGPFVVAAAQKFGNGTLLVVSDSQFLLNSEWTIADNHALIGNLFTNSSVFIDASHWTASPLASSTAQLKAEFRQTYNSLSGSPARYVLTVSSVLVAFTLVPSLKSSRARPTVPGERSALFHKGFLEEEERGREKHAK